MIICFDLDGTLYDSLAKSYELDNDLAKEFGIKGVSLQEYRTMFQSLDWEKLYEDLGYPRSVIKEVLKRWYEVYDGYVVDVQLVIGAKQILEYAEELSGKENVFIITNQLKNRIKQWFERDNLMHFFPDLRRADAGKAHLIEDLAKKHHTKKIVYVGDLVVDGMECQKVKEAGFDIIFIAMAHDAAYNNKERLEGFTNKHDWAHLANDYEELKQILSELK